VPVLQHPWFFGGLIIFAAGYSLQITVTLLARVPRNKVLQGVDALRFGIWTSAIAAALAMGAFTWSYLGIPRTVVGQGYYEYLFWGGGHVLQFTHTLLKLVAWIWLAQVTGAEGSRDLCGRRPGARFFGYFEPRRAWRGP